MGVINYPVTFRHCINMESITVKQRILFICWWNISWHYIITHCLHIDGNIRLKYFMLVWIRLTILWSKTEWILALYHYLISYILINGMSCMFKISHMLMILYLMCNCLKSMQSTKWKKFQASNGIIVIDWMCHFICTLTIWTSQA